MDAAVTNETDQPVEDAAAPTLDALMAERRKKREALVGQGIDPYPSRFDRTALAGDLQERHAGLDPDVRTGEKVRLAGRVTAVRRHGKLSFATLADVSGSIQLLLQVSVLTDQSASVLDSVDLGDWIGAEGEVITSRRGELSVDTSELWLLSKSLRPLPDKWHGLTETDTRYRQREVDLLANPDSRKVFEIRFAAIAAMRRHMEAEHFVEVETPILQSVAGGAAANRAARKASSTAAIPASWFSAALKAGSASPMRLCSWPPTALQPCHSRTSAPKGFPPRSRTFRSSTSRRRWHGCARALKPIPGLWVSWALPGARKQPCSSPRSTRR